MSMEFQLKAILDFGFIGCSDQNDIEFIDRNFKIYLGLQPLICLLFEQILQRWKKEI
jgi:hypothetical protein